MWKTAFKKFELMWHTLAYHINLNFLKTVFQKFYLVHSWILRPICSNTCNFFISTLDKNKSHFYQIMFLKISLSREWNFPAQASSTLPLTLTVIISFCILKPTYFLTSYEDGIGSSEMRSQIFSQFVNCFVVFSKIEFHMKKN